MPVLAAYIGAHDVSGLIYKSPDEYSFWTFPYVYSPELLSAFTTETAFYRSLFEQMCKNQDLKLTDCDVIISGFLEPPKLDLGLKMYISLYELLTKVENFYPIMINNYAVATKEQLFSSKPVTLEPSEFQGADVEDFYANLTIYPNVVASDIVSRVEMDSSLLKSVSSFKISTDKPLVFLGSRFKKIHGIDDINTLLILQMLQGTGVHEVYVDNADVLLLTNLFRIYTGRDGGIMTHPEKFGTVISVANSLECLVTSQIGTSQIIDLEKDKIFIMPMSPDERTKIMIKASGAPQSEKIVSGGTMGLLFDTRTVKSDFNLAYRQYNSLLRSSEGVLK